MLFLLADSPKSATWEAKGQKGRNPKPSAFYNSAYLLFCHLPVLPTPPLQPYLHCPVFIHQQIGGFEVSVHNHGVALVQVVDAFGLAPRKGRQ